MPIPCLRNYKRSSRSNLVAAPAGCFQHHVIVFLHGRDNEVLVLQKDTQQ